MKKQDAITATAPGKLFLTGEYAVLEGAPALLIPVPQRSRVELMPAPLNYPAGCVVSSDAGAKPLDLNEALDTLPLLRSIVASLDCRESLSGQQLTLDTSEFFNGDTKLGLGSSAALTAALVKLLRPALNQTAQSELAQHCHRDFQGGRGSGADIALSIADHCIIHQRDGMAKRVSLPPTLNMLAIWTGEAASTTQYLKLMESWRDKNANAYLSQMTCLHKIADATVAAVNTGDATAFLGTITQYDRQLDDLSAESGLNFYNPTHRELRKKVELLHCTYKPSGAGGGDFGIAYSSDRHGLKLLSDRLLADDRYCFFLAGD